MDLPTSSDRYVYKSKGCGLRDDPSYHIVIDQEDSQFKECRAMERLKKDKGSIALLLLLYTLQGIPIGLASSVPIILQTKKIGYRQQAMFSLVAWPFSIKLFWAPVVDSLYNRQFGRRKSWLIPVQYSIGVAMILLSYCVGFLLGDVDRAPSVFILTVLFFILHFLVATQDIAVDGWALTMLSKENVGYASTCNSVGQTTGFFLSYTIFLALQSKEFCNSYLRSEPQDVGIVDLPDFLFIFGVMFVAVTTAVWFFKKERREVHEVEGTTLLSGYMQLLNVLKLPSVQAYALAILTSKIAFAAAHSVTGLKLIEAGLPSERVALIAIPLVPVQIILPWVISRFTAGPRPLSVYLRAYVPRMLLGLVLALLVLWTSSFEGGSFPFYYYIVLIAIYVAHQVCASSMFVSAMAFHAKISDPSMGGTYMTLLNTLTNLAGTCSGTLALWMVDNVSFKDCEGVTDVSLDCDTMQELQACQAAGGHCVTHLDGYYLESVVCVLVGVLWLCWQGRKLKQLQHLDDSEWKASQPELGRGV